MAIVSKLKNPVTKEEPVKKVAVQYKELFDKADEISASAQLRLTAIEKELYELQQEKADIKGIISDIARYNLGT